MGTAGTSVNYLNASARIFNLLLRDALQIAKRQPPDLSAIKPLDFHERQRQLIAAESDKPEVAIAYDRIRRSLFNWPEFGGVREGARKILEVVIELARNEALPWYLAVPAKEVRKMARLAEGSFTRSVRELETLAVTRPARRVRLIDHMDLPNFPGTVDTNQPLEPIAQWVLRYRRGVPWHANRAAWWINYDLLCGTGRVMPGFIVTARTLSKTYQARNCRMGRPPPVWIMRRMNGAMSGDPELEDGLTAMQEQLTRTGPFPPFGFRAPLWRPVAA